MHLSPKGWLACSWEWKEPLDEALKDGTQNLRLQHHWKNRKGEWKSSWYSIDLTDIDNMKQTNEKSGVERQLAVFREAKLAEAAATQV